MAVAPLDCRRDDRLISVPTIYSSFSSFCLCDMACDLLWSEFVVSGMDVEYFDAQIGSIDG